MNDYSKVSTEDLEKMEKSAYEEYYALATRPCTNPTQKDLEPLEKATAKWEAICEELQTRKKPLKEQIQAAANRAEKEPAAQKSPERSPAAER